LRRKHILHTITIIHKIITANAKTHNGYAWWFMYRELPKEEVEESKRVIRIRIE